MKGWQMKELKELVTRAGGTLLLCSSPEEAREKAKNVSEKVKVFQITGDVKHYIVLPEEIDISATLERLRNKTALDFQEI
ncbi:MAG: hypothetical protein J7J32_04105 [Candidatus Atribacteria bacterium]|nr:hypothetical protein [Candidatus Atribacteria bacterium]MCD6350270.1 hypothetical protein [Candidatus Atribacteria bacterium]